MKWPAAVLGGAALGALAFWVFPWLDLTVSGWFYDPARGFWLSNTAPAMAVYHGVTIGIRGFIVALLLGLVYSHVSRSARARQLRRPLWFLFFVLALGPGLITDSVLKNNWGRPRPEAIAPFGGQGHYVRPGVISNQCDVNCSFVSGHAATAFYLIAFGWVFPRRRRTWLAIGIAAGSVTGLVRIVQGGHFLTDIFFSYWVVWLTATGVWWLMARWWPLPDTTAASAAKNDSPA